MEKEFYNQIVNKVFVTPETISYSTKIIFQKVSKVAAALCEEKIKAAIELARKLEGGEKQKCFYFYNTPDEIIQKLNEKP